jgi:predicted acylesterase/phospholipase RssA
MSLSLLQLPHLNLSSLLGPIKSLAQRLRDTIVPNSDPNAMESIFDGYSDILNAPFQARGFERVLNTLFSKPGTTNNFRRLKKRLYIGATDQDARTHVLFGDPPHDEIPISRAIEASISINPVFRSTEINGRYYCDGAVTRTSGFSEAVKKGATLVLAIDPFVPYVSKRPGYAHHKGALYHVDQDIRTVTFTRYETTRHWLLRHCPDVSLYTFLPANRLRKVMSVNPMDHRPYLAIWRGAYLSTLKRILAVKHRLTGDLATRGIALNTDRAEEVAKRLEATRKLTFQDFFPDGQPSLRPSGRLTVKLPARQFPLLQPSLA